ncbi:hypothetical protein MIND_01403000 [Mycena indigotica]|uniref:Uncharacterized protein n=1 Tax=Mycena indigotica TaxID=2126181 RepID=A0A8H6VP35_9AGAR|nr:uncharacterized protein MIND_01403000 [Mycena indigotica]KAF7288872.1 hypothetical protein MIND_01403000 [Mycena indigotica]
MALDGAVLSSVLETLQSARTTLPALIAFALEQVASEGTNSFDDATIGTAESLLDTLFTAKHTRAATREWLGAQSTALFTEELEILTHRPTAKFNAAHATIKQLEEVDIEALAQGMEHHAPYLWATFDALLSPSEELVHYRARKRAEYRARQGRSTVEMEIDQEGVVEISEMTMQVVGDIVILALNSGGRLVLLDWRRGTCVLDWSFAHALSLHFLTPRLFLLVSAPDPPALDDSDWADHDDGAIHVYVLPDSLAPGVTPELVAKLHFPPRSTAQVCLGGASLFSGPYMARIPSDKPLYQDNDRRIVSLVAQYEPGGWMRITFHIRTVLQLVAQWRIDGKEKTVKWNEWGPREARMFTGNAVGLFWPRHVHGERIILPSDSTHALRILDFNMPRALPVDENNEDVLLAQSKHPYPGRLRGVLSVTDVEDEGQEDNDEDEEVLHDEMGWCQPRVSALVQPGLDAAEKPQTINAGVFMSAMHTRMPYRETRRALRPAKGRKKVETHGMLVMDEQWVVAADTTKNTTDVVFFKISLDDNSE